MPITESHGQDQYIVVLWQNRFFFLENYEVNNITKVYFDKKLSKAATKNVHPPTKSFCAFFLSFIFGCIDRFTKEYCKEKYKFLSHHLESPIT